jgi:hypothetical protein
MKHRSKSCAECSPQCRVEVIETQEGALARYWALFKQGLMPNLCQQHDGTFQVCHEEGRRHGAKPTRVREVVF